MSATLMIERREEDIRVLVLDCPCATTTVGDVNGPAVVSDAELVRFALLKHRQTYPHCRCTDAIERRYGALV